MLECSITLINVMLCGWVDQFWQENQDFLKCIIQDNNMNKSVLLFVDIMLCFLVDMYEIIYHTLIYHENIKII